MKCNICKTDRVFKDLGQHIRFNHEISPKDYYDIYLKSGHEDVCICGNKKRFVSMNKGYTKYCSSACANRNIFTDEVRAKQSESAKRRTDGKEVGLKISEAYKKKFLDEKYRKNFSDIRSRAAYKISKASRKRQSETMKRLWTTDAFRRKQAYALNREDVKKKQSLRTKEQWRDPKFRELMNFTRQKLRFSDNPNNKEKELFKILNEICPGYFKWVGNWTLIIGSFNPDFVSSDNKFIVEHFGDYWHRNDSERQIRHRVDVFKSFGYDTLIVWEKELLNKITLTQKIKDMLRRL